MRNLWLLMVLSACAEPLEPAPVVALSPDDRGALELDGFGPNPGGLKLFLYAPTSPKPGAGLVVALHGCLQTAADFQKVGWNALAEAHGFYVLYAQSSASSGCFRWFEPGQASRGQGEAASVVSGVDWVLQRYAVDRRRVFVTGLSAGAAMSVALLAGSPDVFSAGAIFAGVPAGCASTSTEGVRCMGGVDLTAEAWALRAQAFWPLTPLDAPRIQVWTGAQDTTVKASMARELVEQWTALHGLDAVPEEREAVRRVTSEVHGAGEVQLVTVSDFEHAVPVAVADGCGSTGPFVKEAGVCGAREAARFFGLIADAVPSTVELLDAGAATETDAGVGVMVADAGVASTDAGVPRCKEASASPTWHVWLRRAEVCGFFGTLACAKGSNELLGSTLSSLPVAAWTVDDVTWRAGTCP